MAADRCGVPHTDIKRIGGWKTQAMLERYLGANEGRMRRAFALMDAGFGKRSVHAIITADEHARLTALKLASKMPDGWDGADALARYKAAGIELVENAGFGKKPGAGFGKHRISKNGE